MKSQKTDEFFELVSKVTLSRIKALADQGTKIHPSTLAATLSSHAEIRNFLTENIEVTGSAFLQSDDPDALRPEVEKLLSQKAALVKQLDEFEHQCKESDQFFRQALILMAELSSYPQNQPLQEQIDNFKRLIKQHAGIEPLKAAFLQIKDMLLKEVNGGFNDQVLNVHHPSKRTSLLGKWLKREVSATGEIALDQTYMDLLKETQYNFLVGLRRTLGKAYLKPLSNLANRIDRLDHFEDFKMICNDLLTLLQDFIGTISTEREAAAAAVIHEIGQQVSEMEHFLADSLIQFRKTHQSNADFNSRMVAELKELNRNTDFSQTLEELKTAVVSKLATIKLAIEQKRNEDRLRNNDIAQKIEHLRQSLAQMKKEADIANEKAESFKKELLLDPLTGALNRKAYNERIQEELERYYRYKRLFSLLLFDVDHFKNINDRFGHAIGDKCLQEITLRAKSILRKNDLLFRFGGEEFVVLLSETNVDGGVLVAEKLRRTIENIDFIHKGQTLKITISIGVTMVNPSDKDVSTLLKRVDAAMYEAKKRGRNRVVLK